MTDSDSPPDLLIVGCRVYAAAGVEPTDGVLLRDGRVVLLGTEAEVRSAALAGTSVLDLRGATVTPGLTDAHVHLTAWALAERQVKLDGARGEGEAAARIRAAAGRDEPGGWMRGHGWDANRWGALPTRASLDAVVADRPVAIDSHDLHALWVNGAALLRAGIHAGTPDPEGGRIVRDPVTGEPTGVLLETAKQLIEACLPPPDPAEVHDALLQAQQQLHRWGVTGVHSVEPTGLADFTGVEQAGQLRIRVLQSVPLARLNSALSLGLRSGFGGDWIRIGGVKMFLDGALGSRTALLREPYVGTADHGVETLPLAEFREVVERAAAGGIAATVHAIGDAAVERALDVLGDVPAPAAMPHRIEHVQLCPPDLWERAARSGITLSMQPVHLRSDIPAAERHWGHDRSRGAYPFGALNRAGARLAFGSDCPVETPDPRQGLYAAVRRTAWGAVPEEEWYPEHALSAEEALRAYTEGPAAAAGAGRRRGMLLPGFDADLVAWDVDPFRCGPEALPEMRCVLTVVGGTVVHSEVG